MKTSNPPEVGWGILQPDPELQPETLDVIARLRALPHGQREALLTRAVPRYLAVELRLEDGQEPSKTQMVECSSMLSNFFGDMIGLRY